MSQNHMQYAPIGGQPDDLDDCRIAHLFGQLSDPTRLSLLRLLRDGERCVSDLCAQLRLPQPTVSHHLSLLLTGGVLTRRRDGKRVYYSLDARTGRQLLQFCDHLRAAA